MADMRVLESCAILESCLYCRSSTSAQLKPWNQISNDPRVNASSAESNSSCWDDVMAGAAAGHHYRK